MLEMDHFVDEALHSQVVDQELDLGDFSLDAFCVISHGSNRLGSLEVREALESAPRWAA